MRVSPTASAPNISARWLIDLSPGTRRLPVRGPGGRDARSGFWAGAVGGPCGLMRAVSMVAEKNVPRSAKGGREV